MICERMLKFISFSAMVGALGSRASLATPPISNDVHMVTTTMPCKTTTVGTPLTLTVNMKGEIPHLTIRKATLIGPTCTFRLINAKCVDKLPAKDFDWSTVPAASSKTFTLDVDSPKTKNSTNNGSDIIAADFAFTSKQIGYWQISIGANVGYDEHQNNLLVWQHDGALTVILCLEAK